ncbi:MAG: hypothetical protein JKX92_13630 [Porticoccaceae bacterium]|nr:hypothetical protein [Porticoccaceae bacterium]
MNSRWFLLCTLLAMILLQGCGSLSVDRTPSFVAQQRSMALVDQNKGELASALDHWRVLLLARPDDLQAREQVATLQGELDKKAQVAYSKGLAALAAGRQKRARKRFEETLAARPSHSKALMQLKKIKSLQMNKSQHDKVRKTQRSALANGGAVGPDRASLDVDQRLRSHVRRIKAYLVANQLFQADAQYQHAAQIRSKDLVAKEQLASLSEKLADSYYRHARSLVRSDLNKAIEYLQISLRYESDESAQGLLQRSRLIRDNLTKIQGYRAGEINN